MRLARAMIMSKSVRLEPTGGMARRSNCARRSELLESERNTENVSSRKDNENVFLNDNINKETENVTVETEISETMQLVEHLSADENSSIVLERKQ